MSYLEVEGLTKKFGSQETEFIAVSDLDFEVERGELFTLLGPSGCGKTTTLRSIAGLETIDAGRIVIDGEPVVDIGEGVFVSAQERDIGLVFQSYALWPHMTVEENLKYVLKSSGYSEGESEEQIDHALDLVNLPDLKERYPSELSGGQQQRVALARSVAYEPSLLLMDEPLSNLDFKQRREMRRQLLEILDEVGITTVYVTHDQEEAFEISDEILVLSEGEKAQQGPPEGLYQQPASTFVADFLGEANITDILVDEGASSPGTVVGYLDRGETMRIEALSDRGATVEDPAIVARPEDVEILNGDRRPDVNTFDGTIEQQLYRGQFTQTIVDLGPFPFKVQTRKQDIAEGDPVTIYVPPDAVRVVPRR